MILGTQRELLGSRGQINFILPSRGTQGGKGSKGRPMVFSSSILLGKGMSEDVSRTMTRVEKLRLLPYLPWKQVGGGRAAYESCRELQGYSFYELPVNSLTSLPHMNSDKAIRPLEV